jgi:ornithine cyclodeaminase
MIYLSEKNISKIGNEWQLINANMRKGIDLISSFDHVQPLKPYLRFGNMKNRIIAMPAFAGGDVNVAGIKWIASFPDNIYKKISRAHSVTILNDATSGVPFCIINANQISALRTAGVTSVIMQEYLSRKEISTRGLKLGITGFGPIGQHHLDMCAALFGEMIGSIHIHDPRCNDRSLIPEHVAGKVIFEEEWEKAYDDADIFITCTVSSNRYINRPPKPGSLHCNISLRDYQSSVIEAMSRVIVDDWEEICREKTDIECMHLENRLNKADVFSFSTHNLVELFDGLQATDTIMFNPMGMAVFDICTAKLYYELALMKQEYTRIPEANALSLAE